MEQQQRTFSKLTMTRSTGVRSGVNVLSNIATGLMSVLRSLWSWKENKRLNLSLLRLLLEMCLIIFLTDLNHWEEGGGEPEVVFISGRILQMIVRVGQVVMRIV